MMSDTQHDNLHQTSGAALSENGEEDIVYSQLVDYYMELAEQSLNEAFGPERATWMALLEQEHVNLRPIFAWLIRQGEGERGLRLAFLLQELWFEDHHTSEARELFKTLLGLPEASARTRERARYLDLAGAFALAENDYAEARVLKEEGIEICRELEADWLLGSSLLHLGHVERYAGNSLTAQKLYQESLQIFQGQNNQAWIAHAVGNLSNVAVDLGEFTKADALVKESLQLYQELAFEWDLALMIGNASGVAAGLGQAKRAIRLAGASAAHREILRVLLLHVRLRARHNQKRVIYITQLIYTNLAYQRHIC
ncbi:MAG: tetratricopeptide repeat protein [Caldilineaceae bacterium]